MPQACSAVPQERRDSPAKEAERAELAAWQAVLPEVYPEIAGDRVLDVVAVSSGRILLLTDLHVAMLKVRPNLQAPDLGGERSASEVESEDRCTPYAVCISCTCILPVFQQFDIGRGFSARGLAVNMALHGFRVNKPM